MNADEDGYRQTCIAADCGAGAPPPISLATQGVMLRRLSAEASRVCYRYFVHHRYLLLLRNSDTGRNWLLQFRFSADSFDPGCAIFYSARAISIQPKGETAVSPEREPWDSGCKC